MNVLNEISTELSKINESTENIKLAIESKGVISQGKLSNFANEIRSIENITTHNTTEENKIIDVSYYVAAITLLENFDLKIDGNINVKFKLDKIDEEKLITIPYFKYEYTQDSFGEENYLKHKELFKKIFYKNTDLKSVENITTLKTNAFLNFNFEYLKLYNLTTIEKNAFKGSFRNDREVKKMYILINKLNKDVVLQVDEDDENDKPIFFYKTYYHYKTEYNTQEEAEAGALITNSSLPEEERYDAYEKFFYYDYETRQWHCNYIEDEGIYRYEIPYNFY